MPSSTRHRLLWLLAVALFVPVVIACYIVWYTYFVVHPYEHVVRGVSETQVLASMGRPNRVTGVPQNVAWDGDDTIKVNQGECVKEFWYEPPSITGEAYTVGFDLHGCVVAKYHYSSP